jgi:UDP-glucose 4-epimerase
MMNILVTGGAGFIGRWLVKQLLDLNHDIWILDDLSNGKLSNIASFKNHPSFKAFVKNSINDTNILSDLFKNNFDICYHLAASINVQDSIDDPITTYNNDATGTLNVLEACRKTNTKLVYMSTCMVYNMANSDKGISEESPLKAASPYAGAKLAGEFLTESYFHTYNLPTVIVRPFNTYGPHQKSSGEGGVVSIFINNELNNETINIYGDGTQTRDLLYVEDCADFIIQCGLSEKANGQVINAGSGKDISINNLAKLIANKSDIQHVTHIHPQSEIPKLLCNYSKATKLLSWKPKTSLEKGIEKTKEWIKTNKQL